MQMYPIPDLLRLVILGFIFVTSILMLWGLLRLWTSEYRQYRVLGCVLTAGLVAWFAHTYFARQERQTIKAAENAEYHARKAAAEAHFAEVCKKAGTFVYKEIPPQESLLLMKPVDRLPTNKELQDQYWMGDPYGHAMGGIEYFFKGLLSGYSKRPIDFEFIEALDADDPNKLWRYTVISPQSGEGRMQLIKEPITIAQSRYGTTWDDISTPEDRQHWIACGRRQIIDLKTHDVVIEHIGCKFDSWFGSTIYQRDRPWAGNQGGSCPTTDLPGFDWFRKYVRHADISN